MLTAPPLPVTTSPTSMRIDPEDCKAPAPVFIAMSPLLTLPLPVTTLMLPESLDAALLEESPFVTTEIEPVAPLPLTPLAMLIEPPVLVLELPADICTSPAVSVPEPDCTSTLPPWAAVFELPATKEILPPFSFALDPDLTLRLPEFAIASPVKTPMSPEDRAAFPDSTINAPESPLEAPDDICTSPDCPTLDRPLAISIRPPSEF